MTDFSAPGYIGGVRIIESALAETIKVWHAVERHSRWKRRRQWRVVRHERREPCAYRLADGSLVMHPSLFAQFKRQFATA